MERSIATLEEVAIEKVIDLPSISKKDFVSGCFRMGEDYRLNGEIPDGWGDCKECTPDFLAYKKYKDFIPNEKCKGYIPCRSFNVLPKDESEKKM